MRKRGLGPSASPASGHKWGTRAPATSRQDPRETATSGGLTTADVGVLTWLSR